MDTEVVGVQRRRIGSVDRVAQERRPGHQPLGLVDEAAIGEQRVLTFRAPVERAPVGVDALHRRSREVVEQRHLQELELGVGAHDRDHALDVVGRQQDHVGVELEQHVRVAGEEALHQRRHGLLLAEARQHDVLERIGLAPDRAPTLLELVLAAGERADEDAQRLLTPVDAQAPDEVGVERLGVVEPAALEPLAEAGQRDARQPGALVPRSQRAGVGCGTRPRDHLDPIGLVRLSRAQRPRGAARRSVRGRSGSSTSASTSTVRDAGAAAGVPPRSTCA